MRRVQESVCRRGKPGLYPFWDAYPEEGQRPDQDRGPGQAPGTAPAGRQRGAAAALTVGDVLEDLLAHGVDGLSARTVTLYRGTIVKALNEELGTVRLTELTAGNVHGALAAMAPQLSTRTLQIAHNVLVPVIRQADRDDLSACSACSSRCGAVRKNLSLPPKLAPIGQAPVQGVLGVLPD